MVKEGRSVIQVIKFFGSAVFLQSYQYAEKILQDFHYACRYSLQQAVQDRTDFIKTAGLRVLYSKNQKVDKRWLKNYKSSAAIAHAAVIAIQMNLHLTGQMLLKKSLSNTYLCGRL